MAALGNQLYFTGTAECEAFVANPLRADRCRECQQKLEDHREEAVPEDAAFAVLAARSPANRIASWAEILARRDGTAGSQGGSEQGGDTGRAALWHGGYLACKAESLAEMGVNRVVATAKGLEAFFVKWGKSLSALEDDGLVIHRVEWIDAESQELGQEEIANAVSFMTDALASGHSVLVFCAQGKSRSTALVIAFLLTTIRSLTYDDALAWVRSARPLAEPNPGFERQLRALAEAR